MQTPAIRKLAHRQTYPIELAVRALLDHRPLFCNTLAQNHATTIPMREFVGRRPLPDWKPDAIEPLEERLGRELREKGGYRLEHWREQDLHFFLVRYISAVQCSYDTSGGSVTTLVLPSVQWDLLVFDARTGRLRVSACEGPCQALYLAALGELVGGAPDWFAEAHVVRLEGLVELAARPLVATRGLVAVRLVELASVEPSALGRTQLDRGADAFTRLEQLRANPARASHIRSVTFALQPASDGRWRTLTLLAPDLVCTSWRIDAAARRFAETHGLLVVP